MKLNNILKETIEERIYNNIVASKSELDVAKPYIKNKEVLDLLNRAVKDIENTLNKFKEVYLK